MENNTIQEQETRRNGRLEQQMIDLAQSRRFKTLAAYFAVASALVGCAFAMDFFIYWLLRAG